MKDENKTKAQLIEELNELRQTDVAKDITQRRHIEEALERNKEIFQEIGKMAQIGGWELDLATMKPFFTEEIFHIYELPVGQPPPPEEGILFYAPESRPLIEKAVDQAIKKGTPYDLELRFITAKGKKRWVRSIGRAEWVEGKATQLYGVMQDITERKQMEEELRITLAIQQVRNEVLQMDTEASWERVNVSLHKALRALVVFNTCCINLVDLPVNKMTIHGLDAEKGGIIRHFRESVPPAVLKAMESGQYQYRRTRKDPLFAASTSAMPRVNSVIDIPFAGGTLAVNSTEENAFTERDIHILEQFAQVMSEAYRRLQDITEHKQFEERQHFQASLLEAVKQAVIVTNANGHITYWNPYAEKLYGWSASEISGRLITDVTVPQIVKDQALEIMETLAAGKRWEGEFTVQRKDGITFPALITNTPILGDDKELVGIIGISTDISAQKQEELEQRRTLEQLQLAIDTAKLGIWRLNIETGYLDWNDELLGIYGTSREEFERDLNAWRSQVHPDDSVYADSRLSAVFDGESVFDVEFRVIRPHGEIRHVNASASPVFNKDGELVELIGLNVDITNSKVQERELIRLERLRAVGELSAGISHNLNNILTNVLGPAQLLKRKTDDPELLREIDDISASAIRARDLVHELHLSVRTSEEDPLHPVSVNKVVEEAVQTSRPRWKDQTELKGISIEVSTQGREVPPIEGSESGLHAILTNLIFNAVDAMPKGGVIAIETQHIANQVEIIFSDTGEGMDEETKRRIFEPFFTTKMNIGTGLGMSTLYRTVTNWGGTVEVDSTPEEGTKFTLRFPVWKKDAVSEERETAARSTRTGKILVADDDDIIGRMLSRFLGEQYEVKAFTDGRQALEQFAPGKYDVAMIDLGMPGISGDQLMRQMKDIDPHMTTVLITGWDLPSTDARVQSFDFQIAKPFIDLDEIEDVIAQAITLHDERAKNTD